MTIRFHTRHAAVWPAASAFLVAIFCLCFDAEAQLRIVTYNTATGNVAPGVQTARSGADIIFKSIGEESINGIARPIDVLLLQEQFSLRDGTDDHFDDVAAQSFVDVMNSIYGTVQVPTPYARGYIDAATSAFDGQGGGPGIVYNTQTVTLIEELRFGEVSGTEQARSTMRYQLRPVGYDSSADFYAYNSHYKAGSASDDQARRLVEATSIRTDPNFGSDSLGAGAHAIFVGDYNMSSSNEAAFQKLISAGDGQANDPLNRLGSWSSNASFADIHTQAPCLSDCGGLTPGGMDDRFDFQLMTGEFLDGVGLSYIGANVPNMPGGTVNSYHAFGNNGSTYNLSVNNRNGMNQITNTYPFQARNITSYTPAQIVDALATVSDHLPVVADFQLPSAQQNPELQAAKWTFETSKPVANNMAVITNIAPELGSGNARGVHASASTDYSNPAGNGSPESFSSGNWAVGDFYEFSISTIGYEDIRITFDQTSSNTGPRDFRLEYSSDGTTFLTTGLPSNGAYMVLANDTPNPMWSSGAPQSIFSYAVDLTGISALDNKSAIYLRLVDASTISANGGSVSGGGTDRVDNFAIFYHAIAGIPGDYNDDDIVDARDYVVFRKWAGTSHTLPHDPFGGTIDIDQYNTWAQNYGKSLLGSGGDSTNVPEPAAWLAACVAACLLATRRGTLTAWSRKP